jgi:hypothetical protein
MPLFPDNAILVNSDLVGHQKLFGSQPTLDDAVDKYGFPKGRIVNGMRKRTGKEVNDWWDSRPTEKLNRQAAAAGRRRKGTISLEVVTPG